MKYDDHDRVLAADLQKMVSGMVERRHLLGWLAVAGAAAVAGCGSSIAPRTGGGDVDRSSGAGSTGGSTSAGKGSCSTTPEESPGPMPGDGTNGQNALTLTGIVRSDITSSIGGASGVAKGVPLTLTLKIVNAKGNCAPLAGYAVYVWHCDRDGNYSMYSDAVANENYLRGVQETNADGSVTFKTIFPACYQERWPHIHFEVYRSLDSAKHGSRSVLTSNLALPKDTCDMVFATSGYSESASNLSVRSLETDPVFGDGVTLQLARTGGSVAGGITAELTVAV